MKTIITKQLEKLKSQLEEFFEKEEKDLASAEEYFGERLGETVCNLLSAYYEKIDSQLLADKAWRKAAGLMVERRGDERQVVSQLGIVRFHRTYYAQREGGYEYPVDAVVGIEPYQRVSTKVGETLVEAALEMSYAKSSQMVTGGQVSRQTVMKKIRQAVPVTDRVVRRQVPVLHVDADEDHVKLQDGSSRIVPLVSIYEGIEQQGKRRACKNVFHRSSFGQKTDVFWEETLTELERRYDLTDTKIYLHGDGAAWIKQGQEWLPNSIFVLDRYHANKALKHAVSGIERKSGSQYEHLLRKALNEGDKDGFCSIRDSMLLRWPERRKTIGEAASYLYENIDAIRIYNTDAEARSGGATEPHVSHVLSSRLSSRPMGWSTETLQSFVPLLAAGSCTLSHAQPSVTAAPRTAGKSHPTPKTVPNSLGLPHPDIAVSMPGKSGKISPLYRLLQSYCR